MSKTGIAKLALAHLGHTKELTDLDTDNFLEANICRVFFDNVRKRVLTDTGVYIAKKKYVALALDEAAPTPIWGYGYAYPSDCLKILSLYSGEYKDTMQSRIQYEIGYSSSGAKLIYTNEPDARLDYIFDQTDYDEYPAQLDMTMSYLLAHYIIPKLAKGDQFQMKERMLQYYEMEKNMMSVNMHNEEALQEDPASELQREGFSFNGHVTKY